MKSTKATVQQRVAEVLVIRLQGAELYDIRRYAAEQTPPWNVSDRQLERYAAAADALLAQTLEKDRDKLLNRHHAARRALLARALQLGDVRTALAVLRDEAELLDLYPAKRHQLTGKDGGPLAVNVESMTDEERRAAIAAIVARYGLPPGGIGGPAADRNGAGEPHGPLLG
jgi:hypothetical protein